MRSSTLRTAIQSLMLMTLGGAAVSTPVAQASITATKCVSAVPSLAHIGLQLDLLAPAEYCARGSYAPGMHYATVANVTFALSLSTVIAGVVSLLVAVGSGMGVRQTLAALHAWFVNRWGWPVWWTPIPTLSHGLVVIPVRSFTSPRQGAGRCLRGPPPTR